MSEPTARIGVEGNSDDGAFAEARFRRRTRGTWISGFSYLKRKTGVKPAGVLLDAIDESDLDTRVAEGLPWLAMNYADMDWDSLVRNAKLHSRQNRLGFVVALACELVDSKNDNARIRNLRQCLDILEESRLGREDTFCRESMTDAEKAWLRENRSATAAHWNLLTDIKGKDLPYVAPW
jgi:hypothetical protein